MTPDDDPLRAVSALTDPVAVLSQGKTYSPYYPQDFYDGQKIHLILVLMMVQESPFQLEILSHLGQPFCLHCREFYF